MRYEYTTLVFTGYGRESVERRPINKLNASLEEFGNAGWRYVDGDLSNLQHVWVVMEREIDDV